MSSSLTATIVAGSLIVLVALLGSRFNHLKQSYYFGVGIWSRWLPVIATAIYLSLLAVNLINDTAQIPKELNLGNLFSTLELTVFFLIGPLFLTKIGYIVAFGTLTFTIERFVSGGVTAANSGCLYLFTSSVTFIALLGDKMPWLSNRSHNPVAQKIRDILIVGLCIGSLAVIAASFPRIPGFQKWILQMLSIDLPRFAIVLLLVAVFMGWLSVVLGFTRNVTLPLMSLPTLFIFAFVTSWPSYLLIIPFSVCLALALSSADRRGLGARRTAASGAADYQSR